MSQKHLDLFSRKDLAVNERQETPMHESTAETQTSIVPSAGEARKHSCPVPSPANLPASYFVSATYDGDSGKTLIKLYEPESGQIYSWPDNSGHQPYCFTNLAPQDLKKIDRVMRHPGYDHMETVEKCNALLDRNVKVTKIVAKDPLAIGGKTNSIREIIPQDFSQVTNASVDEQEVKTWEANIKYYQSYIYDRRLYPGMVYEVKSGNLILKKIDEVEKAVEQTGRCVEGSTAEESGFIQEWARLLEYPAPKFRRVALDIEVLAPVPSRVPDPEQAAYPVICVSLNGSDGFKRILMLKRANVRDGLEKLPHGIEVEYCSSEKDLLQKVFDCLCTYPFVITFNGDDFDFRYMLHRAMNFGMKRSEVPIEEGRRVCLLKYGIHLDLYKFFFNRSIQFYAFSGRYRDVTLNDVGRALVNLEKIPLQKSLGELTYNELAEYCWRDSEITINLTSFEDELVMKLILVLSRISSMPMEDASRQGVSRWIRNFLQREHRRRNMLIPNPEDILAVKGKTATKAIIKGKKYKGAIVVEPVPGVHFNVAVMDFPSLYPSIIKVWNLGYQTILCPHPECRTNLIPDTPNWVCTKERALESLLVGSLRDLRVQWYKPRSKDRTLPSELRSWYNITQGALKVILNASYGVFGAESFDLYCPPVAEATAAIGRDSITRILKEAKDLGIQVLYGDTDSLFLKNPSKDQVNELSRWTEHELKMSIDIDKVYRYSAFSSRKKNYLGVLEDGTVDVKGLTGKKRHIPVIIKNAFDQMKMRLAKVRNPPDFEQAKQDIKQIVRSTYLLLKRREWKDTKELAFNVVLGGELDRYTKTTPQHVKAAKMLKERGVDLRAGDLISFVKVCRPPHVKPVELASKSEIDIEKYVAYLRSTFDQVLDALGLDFEETIGLTKLERFFG